MQTDLRAKKLGNKLWAQDAMGTVLIHKAKSFQCQVNKKVNMSRVNEVTGIQEDPEYNDIKLPEIVRETTLGKYFTLYFSYCSASNWFT